MSPRVAVVKTSSAGYPRRSPFHPSVSYPEYPFRGLVQEEPNAVYDGVREILRLLCLDADNIDTDRWNPLGHIIKMGMTVVLKPNFVVSHHKDGKDLFAIITHPSVLRAIADYVWIALKGQGRIIIADAPQYDCNWQHFLEATQLHRVIEFYRSFPGPKTELHDLRSYWSKWKHFPSLLESLPGDPDGNMIINLGSQSALHEIPHPEKLYGAVYHRRETIAHHSGDTQEYEVSRTIMNADVVISVPKLKVHKKVGVTLNVKGLVGISTNKNFLVHYRITPPSKGGDQYPSDLFTPTEQFLINTERWMYDHLLAPRIQPLEYLHRSLYWLHNHTTKRLGLKVDERKRLLDAGNWHGNDSAWRMAVDLLKVFLFSDRNGCLQREPQRRAFSIIDGVIGGEVNGPLVPDPLPSGVLLGGENLLAVDLVATRLMGFDPLKIRVYQSLLRDPAFDFGVHSLDDIEVVSSEPAWTNCLRDETNRFLNFKPHPGWVGQIEVQPDDYRSAASSSKLERIRNE